MFSAARFQNWLRIRPMSLSLRTVLVALVLLACHHSPADDRPALASDEKLGAVLFPISCDSSVQRPFERGVALLHSFEFERSDLQFQDVARQDPHCAMAYWGQAMSIYHQLWSRPTRVDLRDGLALVKQAQRLRAPTERERDYIDALSAFYSGYGRLSHQKRVAAYAKAMQRLAQKYPEDGEAQVWYALALLAWNDDDLESLHQKEAIAILTRLLDQLPDHPGVAHYLIHACDEPQFAAQGLAAARKYAGLAASSPHAVHMPSHIFARLGLWQDDIATNLMALEVAKAQAAHGEVLHHQLHAMDFLLYAYLQIGQENKAQAIVDQALHLSDDERERGGDFANYARSEFPALFALESRRWKDALALQPLPGAEPWNRAITFWAHAVAAGHLCDPRAARTALLQYDAMVAGARRSSTPYEADEMTTNRDEAQAWLYFAQGKGDAALRLIRSVADNQDRSGKGEVELPAREMLADMLLEMDKTDEALAEYEKSMKIDPNRFNGLYGAAHAAEKSHQPEKAGRYYLQLLANCAGTDSNRQELSQASTWNAHK